MNFLITLFFCLDNELKIMEIVDYPNIVISLEEYYECNG